jgi:hypothetical protein
LTARIRRLRRSRIPRSTRPDFHSPQTNNTLDNISAFSPPRLSSLEKKFSLLLSFSYKNLDCTKMGEYDGNFNLREKSAKNWQKETFLWG